MKKILLTVLTIVTLFGLSTVSAGSANAVGTKFRHAYRPYTVQRALPNNPNWNNWSAYPNSQIGWTHARVNNFTDTAAWPLVCAEAFRVGGGKTHLGCLRLNLAAHNSSLNWAEEFNVPTNWLRRGKYRIVYTYQGDNGKWYRIWGVTGENWDGMFVAQ